EQAADDGQTQHVGDTAQPGRVGPGRPPANGPQDAGTRPQHEQVEPGQARDRMEAHRGVSRSELPAPSDQTVRAPGATVRASHPRQSTQRAFSRGRRGMRKYVANVAANSRVSFDASSIRPAPVTTR